MPHKYLEPFQKPLITKVDFFTTKYNTILNYINIK